MHILAFGLFVLISVLMTHPLWLHTTDHLPGGLGDPLAQYYVLAWDIHKMETGIEGFWNANLFYPSPMTFALADPSVAIAFFIYPVAKATGNIVLGYNLYFILTFILSAFGMYLLIFYFYRNPYAAFVCGTIFGFSHFRFDHIGHINILSTQWLPFVFLAIHKFWEKRESKYLYLFVLFFLLNVHSCGQHGVFLNLFLLIFFLDYMIGQRVLFDWGLWKKLIPPIFLLTILTLPFILPYISVNEQFDLVRSFSSWKPYSALPQSFITPSIHSKTLTFLLGFHQPEKALFLGFIPLLLFFLAIRSWRTPDLTVPLRTWQKRLMRFLEIAAVIALISYLIVSWTGGFVFSVGPLDISMTRWRNPLIFFSSLFLLRLILGLMFARKLVFPGPPSWARTYWISLVVALFACFYPYYYPLAKILPGFEGTRAISRIFLFCIFFSCFFSARGYEIILDRFGKPVWKTAVTVLTVGFLLIDFRAAPIQVDYVKQGDNIPGVYRWLTTIEEDTPIIELPMATTWDNYPYLYYSTFHWKKMVNGFGSYEPPLFITIKNLMSPYPTVEGVEMVADWKVKYLILHLDAFSPDDQEPLLERMEALRNKLMFQRRFGNDLVYEIAQ